VAIKLRLNNWFGALNERRRETALGD